MSTGAKFISHVKNKANEKIELAWLFSNPTENGEEQILIHEAKEQHKVKDAESGESKNRKLNNKRADHRLLG